MRSLRAASRAAERDADRRRKQRAKENKLQEKADAIAEAASAVEDWGKYTSDLVSIHTDLADSINWRDIADQSCPIEPIKNDEHLVHAQQKLQKFKPSIFHIFKGGYAKILARLEKEVSEAPLRDEESYESAILNYRAALEDWEEDTRLAKQVLDGKEAALRQVVEEMQSFDDSSFAFEVDFSFKDKYVHAYPSVKGTEIVPSIRPKQLANGRLSETKMPVGQFNELYQDYVASVALKTAGDLFQVLPIENVYVTCKANLLDQSTGYQKPTPILSIMFVRSTFLKLNRAHLDPSEAMRNFKHEMRFSKTKGFSAIEALGEDV